MRIVSAFLVIGALSVGGAEASSIVVLPAMTGPLGPSMVAVGQTATPDVTVAATLPEPAQPPIAEPGHIDIISPSVIALGEPAVADENVAAIGTGTKRLGPNAIPMVIRGGVVGDPFAFSPMATSAPVKVQGEPQAAQAPLPASQPEAAAAPEAAEPPAPAAPASPAAPAMEPQ
jgi:hypothetical protein